MFRRIRRDLVRLAIVVGALAAYSGLLAVFYPYIGRLGGMVALVPITLGACFFGIPGSVLVSLAIFPLTTLVAAQFDGFSPLLGSARALAWGITMVYGVSIGVVRHLVEKGRKNEELLRLALEATNDGLWDYDSEADSLTLSDRWYEMLGYSRGDVPETLDGWRSLVHPEDQHHWILGRKRLTQGDLGEIRAEYRMKAADGSYRHVLCRGRSVAFLPDGTTKRVVGVQTDITEQRRAQLDVAHLAYHNQLTGLRNRRSFFEEVERSLVPGLHRHGLVVVDIEGFNQINESLGHDAGDSVLRDVAARCAAFAGAGESLFHLDGDEFALYVPRVVDPGRLAKTARDLLTVLHRPYRTFDEILHLRVVAGVAVFPDDAGSADQLLQAAMSALSRAKREHVDCRAYTEGMEQAAKTHLQMVHDLRRAIAGREFRVHYQPIHVHGEIRGVEALARWEHPQTGAVSPSVFIPVAEEAGLITDIGEQVLETACRDIGELRGTTGLDLYVSVNLSVHQLGDYRLIDVIEDLLSRFGLPASSLRLEVTESSLMVNLEQLLPVLESIRDLGIVLSVDDFGTGYSSLAYLKRLPISVVKIDRSFVIGIPADRRDVAIVRSIVAMAEGLQMELVAEGVDRVEQLNCLAGLGCHGIQGYLYSKPKPLPEIEAMCLLEVDQREAKISRN